MAAVTVSSVSSCAVVLESLETKSEVNDLICSNHLPFDTLLYYRVFVLSFLGAGYDIHTGNICRDCCSSH
jgi:hypothetical protein